MPIDSTFDTRSPTAIRDIRPFRPRRKQIPETSRSGTSTTRRTRSRFLFDLLLPMGVGFCGHQGECTTIPGRFLEFFAQFISEMNARLSPNNSPECARDVLLL